MEKASRTLEHRWADICNEYLSTFCKYYHFDNPETFWVGDKIGGIVSINDYFFSMDVIRYAVDYIICEDVLFKWYYYDLDCVELGLPRRISFESWCTGANLPYDENTIQKIKEAKQKVEDAENELKTLIHELEK